MMKKKTSIIIGVLAIMGLRAVSGILGRKQATISYYQVFYNTMTIDMFSENYPEQEKIPEPVVITVKKFDRIENGYITIKNITDDFITIKLQADYVGYGVNEPADTFDIKKGDTAALELYGLCDATSKLYITYIE